MHERQKAKGLIELGRRVTLLSLRRKGEMSRVLVEYSSTSSVDSLEEGRAAAEEAGRVADDVVEMQGIGTDSRGESWATLDASEMDVWKDADGQDKIRATNR